MAGLGFNMMTTPKTADWSSQLVALAGGQTPTDPTKAADSNVSSPMITAAPVLAGPSNTSSAAPAAPTASAPPAQPAFDPHDPFSGLDPTSPNFTSDMQTRLDQQRVALSGGSMGGLGAPAPNASAPMAPAPLAVDSPNMQPGADTKPAPSYYQPAAAPAAATATPAPVAAAAPQPRPVASGVDAIIAENSPLMQQAAAYGRDQLNARGLVNSSMATGAAQAEMLKVATPIASQEADIASRRDLANLDASTQTALQASRDASAKALQDTQGQQALAQQAADARARAALQETAGQQALAQQAADAKARAALQDTVGKQQTDLQAQDAATKASLQAAELTSQEKQSASKLAEAQAETQANIASQERRDLGNQIAQVASNQTTALSNTLSNDKIGAADRGLAQTNIGTISSNTITQLQNLYGVSVSGAGTTTPTPTPAASPVAGLTPAQLAALTHPAATGA